MEENNKIIIYQTEDGKTDIEVRLDKETVWLTQNQMTQLFQQTKQNISLHINNIFREGELDPGATVKEYLTVQNEAGRKVRRKIRHYNLDVIISTGYRVKSVRGTQFRIWANRILREYLVQGFVINKKQLEQKAGQLDELKRIVRLQERVITAHELKTNETKELIYIISSYSKALNLLDDYDYQRLTLPYRVTEEKHRITYPMARKAIDRLAGQTGASALFGKEKDDSFRGSLENIYQTHQGRELYPSLWEKAAHLLYFVVKNHSFVDGNKRIAAFLFIWFLGMNDSLFDSSGSKIISDDALVALTLMLAESDPRDKDILIKVIVNLLNPFKD